MSLEHLVNLKRLLSVESKTLFFMKDIQDWWIILSIECFKEINSSFKEIGEENKFLHCIK